MAVENQATDLTFRIGRKRIVLAPRFVCQGAVEEKIDVMIETNSALSDERPSGLGETKLTEMRD